MRAPSGAWTFSYSEVRPSVTRIPPLPAEWVRPLSDLAWEVGVTPVQVASFFAGWSAVTSPGEPSSEVVFEELAARRDGDRVGLSALYEEQWPAGRTVTVPLQLVEEMLGAYRRWLETGNQRRATGA